MDANTYWQDIDTSLETLINTGSVKLPSLEGFNLDKVNQGILDDMDDNTFLELGKSHNSFLDILSINEFLTPKLFEIAKKYFNFQGDILDQYHIARRVEPGNSKEMYRAHFDSHLFTMVLPIQIPLPGSSSGSAGDLIYYPNARKTPANEISNILGKAYHKRFASKEGLEKFSLNHEGKTDNFNDYRPLLFIGNTTLHTNKPVTPCCSSSRLTLLAHFFDSSSKYGVGSFLRLVRNR